MKVLHLSLYDRYGGACIAAYRQHQALRRNGVDSKMWVRFKVTDDPEVLPYRPPKQLARRIPRLLRRRMLAAAKARARLRGEMFSAISEHGAHILEGMPQADVINIQFGWDFVDLAAVMEALPREKPVVVTMHEMATFTGGCSYAEGCVRFLESCGKCPKIGDPAQNDLSRSGWEARKKAFDTRLKAGLHFVADSNWLANEARKSSLLRGHPISTIHYGIDTEIFKPLDQDMARSVFNIPRGAKVVCFASASWSNERKGMRYLAEALRSMPEKPFLLTWGQAFELEAPGVQHFHIGNIDNEHFMALAYNAADIFVMPSLEEAFGQTALEAIACGKPVAAFAAGGIPETVRHDQTGLLARVGDSMQLSRNIELLLGAESLRAALGGNGVRVAREEFSYRLNAENYRRLYASLLEPEAAGDFS
jgi:glycosyltransferase involved in cell wall biosynthesis